MVKKQLNFKKAYWRGKQQTELDLLDLHHKIQQGPEEVLVRTN